MTADARPVLALGRQATPHNGVLLIIVGVFWFALFAALILPKWLRHEKVRPSKSAGGLIAAGAFNPVFIVLGLILVIRG